MSDVVEFNNDHDVLVDQIVDRWEKLLALSGRKLDRLSARMDLRAANGTNDNPTLDLEKLIGFDDAKFTYDMIGIQRHMDRVTGRMFGDFMPKCAKETDKGIVSLTYPFNGDPV